MVNHQKEMDDKLRKLLETKVIPFKLTSNWFNAIYATFKYASPISLGINGRDMKDLLKAAKSKNLTYFTFACLNTHLESQSMDSTKLNEDDYFMLMHEASDRAKQWNTDVNKVKNEMLQELIKSAQEQKVNKVVQGEFKIPEA